MALCVVCSTEIRDDARFCPTCGAEQPKSEVAGTDADPLMGKVVARKFKVEKLLGVGGMGKVYKARQLSLDKAVVVKVLHDHFRDDPQLVQRFQREAKAASRLNHPNSIQIIDFGQDDGGVVFMAMEFLQGQDLFSLLKKEGPLAPDRVARVMIQVCSALSEAHEQNVIHRDLKPENIMVEDRRGQKDFVKVLDFGIAKIQDPGEGQQALTQAGMVCGTPEYMSPEQARGLALDPRSDIYALGVVMYQLAVGELPFVSDTPIGIVTKHILEKPVPPRQRAPQLNIPEELENIILKAMEKEADKRFNTVSEMGEALEVLLRNIAPFATQRTSSGEQSGATARAPTASGPQPQQPTQTKPTPTGQTGAASGPSGNSGAAVASNTNANVPEQTSGGGSGMKIAAASFGAVVVVAIIGIVAVKALSKPDDKTDKTVDAGVLAVKVDAGWRPTAAPDAGTATPALTRIVDAGVVALPAIVDAGTKVVEPAVVDAGTKVVEHVEKHTDTPPPPSGSAKAKAAAVFKAAVAKYNEEGNAAPCDQVPKFGEAAQLDPTLAEPLRYIAQCQKLAGQKDRACGAIKEFIKRKHMPPDQAEKNLKFYQCQ